MKLAPEIPRHAGCQGVELDAEAQRGAIARAPPMHDTRDGTLSVEPYVNSRKPKCHDHGLAGERRHIAHDQHPEWGKIDSSPSDQPEIMRSDDLAFEPNGSTRGPPLVCMN
jgi:hypothetical protein